LQPLDAQELLGPWPLIGDYNAASTIKNILLDVKQNRLKDVTIPERIEKKQEGGLAGEAKLSGVPATQFKASLFNANAKEILSGSLNEG
jgi:hypothetical protein